MIPTPRQTVTARAVTARAVTPRAGTLRQGTRRPLRDTSRVAWPVRRQIGLRRSRWPASWFAPSYFTGVWTGSPVRACTRWRSLHDPYRSRHQRLRRGAHLPVAGLVRGLSGLIGDLDRSAGKRDGGDRPSRWGQPSVRARAGAHDRGFVPVNAGGRAQLGAWAPGRAARLRRALFRALAPERGAHRLHAHAARPRSGDGALHQQRARVGGAVAGDASG